MTAVVVQQLSSNQSTRIRCHDLVKKIAIYKDKLAVSSCNVMCSVIVLVERQLHAFSWPEALISKKKYISSMIKKKSKNQKKNLD